MPAFEMGWRDVLVASWPVEPDLLAPRLPDGLRVDSFDGDAYLSVVPFVIEDIRPRGLPAVVGLTTPELNLRTYVRHDDEPAASSDRASGPSGGAPGVYFFTLDADDLLGVIGARLFNQLPYYYAEMDYEPGPPVSFESRRRTPGARAARFAATYGPVDGTAQFRAEPGSLAAFLLERYRYFTEDASGDLRYAVIDHEQWTLRPATWEERTNTLFGANGFDRPASEPELYYSRGVDVTATGSRRCRED